jgi:hypothetical protein
MLSHDWNLPPNLPRCFFADLLYRTAQDTIFSQLTAATTPVQYEQAQSSLLHLKQELEEIMPALHYAAQFGTHICFPDLFLGATIRLKNLQLLHPQQPTIPEPEPLDPEEIFNNLGSDEQTSMDDTYLGTDPNAENKERK